MKGRLQLVYQYRVECVTPDCDAVASGEVARDGADTPVIADLTSKGWVRHRLAPYHEWMCPRCKVEKFESIERKDREREELCVSITRMREEEHLSFADIGKRVKLRGESVGAIYRKFLRVRKSRGESLVDKKSEDAEREVARRTAEVRRQSWESKVFETQEEAVRLVDVEKLTYAEAALRLGISREAFRARYQRAKRAKRAEKG